ncbi:MAG: LPS export ABC transporter periplasmic protein LptC [Pseudolabrys sp.]|nr:LPS export ABC transporter periplasmic protein LptC [Pseudolabrys sp.]
MSRVITARANPDDVRAHWNMSQRDSERAFRAARRHSRLVRFLRAGLPVAIVVALVGLSLATWLNPMKLLTKLPVNMDELVVSGTKITMEQPRVNGFTNDKRAYEFTAKAAAQDLTKPDIVELNSINAKVEMEDKTTMTMVAEAGVYDTKKEMLQLQGNILLTSSNGNTGKLTEATVDVRKGNVTSDKPVELEMLQGILNANKLEVVDSGTMVRFHGGVNMTLMLNGTAVPKKKTGAR